eukprot:scaffold216494_cov36-Tisochrysis_lutea.AAC.1
MPTAIATHCPFRIDRMFPRFHLEPRAHAGASPLIIPPPCTFGICTIRYCRQTCGNSRNRRVSCAWPPLPSPRSARPSVLALKVALGDTV